MEISAVNGVYQKLDVPLADSRSVAAKNAAEQFEAVMLSQSFSQMFKGVKSPSVAGGGKTEKIWQSLMIDEMAKGVAKAGGIGLAENIYKEINK